MKDLKIYLSSGVILLLVYLVAQYNRPKPVDWKESFSRKDKIPFGTYVLYNRLPDIFPQSKILPKQEAPFITFTESEVKEGNYIIIARYARIDEYDFKHLEEYMQKGNNVFIAAYFMGKYLEDTLKLKVNTELNAGENAKNNIRFTDPELNSEKKYSFDKGIGDQYFGRFDTTKAMVLGMNQKGHANFLRFSYGKGNLYLLPSPYFFTNYNLLQPNGADYAAKALSYLPVKDEIIWNEFAALGTEEDTSPMRVFFKHKELRWAYQLTIFGLLIFVLYEIKRRQRVIPVIEPLKNTSVEFAEVVGQVYYQQRDNSNIVQKQVLYLLEHIRSVYNLRTNELDKEFVDKLSLKSGISHDLVRTLVEQIIAVRKSRHVSDQDLIAFNKTIELFHKQSK